MENEVQAAAIHGTPETDQVVDLIVATYKAVQQARADGKLDMNDVSFLMPVFPLVVPAIDKIQNIPAELLDLDTAEGGALLARAAALLGEQPEKVKLIAEGAIEVVAGGLKIFRGIRA